MSTKTGTRLNRFIAKAGIASRRDAEKLIKEGRVTVNDVLVSELWATVQTGDLVKLDGIKVRDNIKSQLFLFNKPRGCLSTSRDQRGRRTIFDLIESPYAHLMIIGRLDYDSEGLMMLTNNGSLKRYLELPKNGFSRSYKVKIDSTLEEDLKKELEKGVNISGINYRPLELKVHNETNKGLWVNVVIKEGKNREIRRIFEFYNKKVIRLIRVGFGPFSLQNLAVGKLKKISLSNIKSLSRFKKA